ncbi:hypothetical protein [Phyllobacterium sp. OV277]|uniref:hypothetical protein n=1 Tax=Phyllobacterium sp. OV277 TaxID=1882772 RepID=UPI000888D7A8|nr:hypothetical protein [Phyllobacterium sp. OV277]SDP37797.1 hypothetical protein SAMN05443582_104383 [Phyllobacterium sp. OV277]
MIEDEQIRTEMMAMQFWLRALFVHAATGTPPTSHSVQELLNELKNLAPQDGGNDLAPADWDEEHLVHYPSFERVGMKIIETLLSLEKKLSS